MKIIDMVTILHIAVFIWCAIECLYSLKRPRANMIRLIIFFAVGIIHGIVPAITPDALWWPTASSSSIPFAAALTLLGVIALSAGWTLADFRSTKWEGLSPGLENYLMSSHGQSVLKSLFWITITVSVLAWLGSMIAAAGSVMAAFQAGRFQFRDTGNIYIKAILLNISHLMAIPGFIGFFLPRRYLYLGVGFAITMAIMLFWGSQGSRADSLGLLASLAIAYALRYQLNTRRIVFFAILGFVIGLMAIAAYEVRKVMYRASLAEMGQMFLTWKSYEDVLARDPLNYHQFFVAAVEHFPRDHAFLNGATYIRLAVFYLPGAYFQSIKPPDTHNTFAKVITYWDTTNTIPPTMMGDGYINFWGAPGVLIVMMFNGFVFAYAQRLMRESLLAFLVIGAPFGRFSMLIIRGSPYEVLVLVIFSAITLFVLLTVLSGGSTSQINRNIRHINRSRLN